MSVQFTWPHTNTVVDLYQSEYCEPNNIALVAFNNSEGYMEEYAVVSTNPNAELEKGFVAIKNWSENEGILNVLIREGVVSTPSHFIRSGFVDIPVCELLVELPTL